MAKGWLISLAALAASPAGAQVTPIIDTPETALAEDAADYARRHSVAPEEALRRLRAQEASVPATDAIAAQYRDRFVGVSIEHGPEYRITVLLKGDEPVADTVIDAGGIPVPIRFRTGARATRAELVAALIEHQAAIRAALPRPPGLGVDPRTGELVVLTANASDAGEEFRDWAEELTGVPVRVRPLDRVDADASGEGGARLIGSNLGDPRRFVCTTGFAVTDGTRTGIVTAAHCPDQVQRIDPAGGPATPLDFVGQWGWSYQDVQVHTSAAIPTEPLFFADTGKTRLRPVAGERRRGSTRAGDVVCHRGETTGYSCNEVEFTDFAPAGDLCGGPCAPSWVAVNGPSCRGGDSGGPVFLGVTAFGIVKGASYRSADRGCNFYYYMAVDFLPPGWSLLTR